MGYDFHVVRDKGLDPISLDEWVEYLGNDPEMERRTHAELRFPDGKVLKSNPVPGLAVWIAMPNPEMGEVWFGYGHGKVTVKNAGHSFAVVDKMKAIARHFGAKVRGEEGEEY